MATNHLIRPLSFIDFDSRNVWIGHTGNGFHFDNEAPAHIFHLSGFRLANQLVSNAGYLEFVQAGGYDTAVLWLSDGWAWKQENDAIHPRYWVQREGVWFEYTLYGLQPLDPRLPVCHVNYYEADAYARWCEKRLPVEQEWEAACQQLNITASDTDIKLHPRA